MAGIDDPTGPRRTPIAAGTIPVDGKSYSCATSWRNGHARVVVVVTKDGKSEIYPLVHHVYHSPDGHAWGYGGSGPSELAKDILWDLMGEKPEPDLYHPFRDALIESQPMDGPFFLSEQRIRGWLRSIVKD